MTSMNTTLDPTIFVIFGGAGDLTLRKLMPSYVTRRSSTNELADESLRQATQSCVLSKTTQYFDPSRELTVGASLAWKNRSRCPGLTWQNGQCP